MGFIRLEVNMANSFSTTSPDALLWKSLKSAIATSSGFISWRSEQPANIVGTSSHEQLVRLYLRETLETLAY